MTGWMRAMGLAAAMVLTSSCVKADAPPAAAHAAVETTPPPMLQGLSDAKQYRDQLVRLRGPVARAKLGDMVQGEHFTAHCTNRLSDAALARVVTVQGTLFELDTSAKELPGGVWSQGTAPGTTSWMLRDCVVVD